MAKKQKHLTPNQIKEAIKKKRELNKRFEENKHFLKSLVGERVKLNQDVYQHQIDNKELSKKFIDWYEINKNDIFTIESTHNDWLFTLKDVDNWLFSASSLIVVSGGISSENTNC